MKEKIKKFVSKHEDEIVGCVMICGVVLESFLVGYFVGLSKGMKPPKHIDTKFYQNTITGEIDFLRINGELYKLH